MKKNFMAIASLLIAAMLLVVSCAPEANVEGKVEDNGLVNASLMATAAGKALTVSYPENEALSYTITLDAKWEANSNYGMDEIVGEKTITRNSISSSDPIDLGWISQGLWTVTVEGKRNGATVYSGSTTKYITTDDNSVVVFLGTDTSISSSTKSTYLDFDITVNELAANNSGYKLKATIENADKRTAPVKISVGDEKFSKNSSNNTKNYKITNSDSNKVVSLTPGYYKVTVQLLNGETVIGGITRGVLVTGESTITIKGSVSASDFANGMLTVIEPKVTINSFTAVKEASDDNIFTSVDTSTNTYKGTVDSDSDGTCKIKYTVTATKTDISASGITVDPTPTYTWFVDGNEISGNNTNTYENDYTVPGHKNVTCLVTYLCTVTIGESNYEFTIGNQAVASVLVKGPAVEGEAPLQTP